MPIPAPIQNLALKQYPVSLQWLEFLYFSVYGSARLFGICLGAYSKSFKNLLPL